MKKIIYILFLSSFFTSCATILNGKYQLVEIKTNPKTEVIIEGEKPRSKNGKFYVKRDSEIKQVELVREGYKSQYEIIAPSKKSPLYYLTWMPVALTPININFIYFLIAGVYDIGPKSKNYDKSYSFEHNLISIPEKDTLLKQLSLNNVAIDVKSEDFIINYSNSYKKFLKGEYKSKKAFDNDEEDDLIIENTIFSEVLNQLLEEKGYIDTTKTLFKTNYANNLYLDAKVTKCIINVAQLKDPNLYLIHSSECGFTNSKINIKWRLLNYYKEPLYTYDIQSSSGDIMFSRGSEILNPVTFAVKDAIENSLFEFMNNKEFITAFKNKFSENQEKNYENIIIPKTNLYVKNVSEAVKSSVTIKTERGHGSGFIIGPNGYILTNYHVITGQNSISVILNNGNSYEAQLIRSSREIDLALLKINEKELIPFEISSSKNIELATEIYAVGTPNSEDLAQTISKGIISGIRKSGNSSRLIQTDASINAGNSGGAIVSKDGLVLGIVSSKLSGYGIEGVAFGIPAYEIFDKLKISFD